MSEGISTGHAAAYLLALAFGLGFAMWLGWRWWACEGVLVQTPVGWQCVAVVRP